MDEDTAAYWDWILHTFGTRTYFERRYGAAPETGGRHMIFSVDIKGTKNVEVEVSDDDVVNAFENETRDSGVENLSVEDINTTSGAIEVEVSFSGTIEVELDDSDVHELVERKAQSLLENEDFEDFEVEDINEL